MTKKVTHAFTTKALKSPTPTWAKNMFILTFALTSALAVFMAGTKIIPDDMKFEVLLGLKALDGFMFTLSKMFGVAVEKVR